MRESKSLKMPELPEVETIVTQLRSKILGKTIKSAEILDKIVVDNKISGKIPFKINNINRRGKSIIFDIGNSNYILTHLRMTGHFHYLTAQEKTTESNYQKYCVAKFYLNDNSLLTHNSIRRFGRMTLMNKTQLTKALSKLGPEPLSPKFTAKEFIQLLSKSPNAIIKNKLLDQSVIAGIGNIYAQEALYHAGISPSKKIAAIPELKLKRLHQEIVKILTLAIHHNGTTVENYTNLNGKGGFQDYLAVYQKEYCPKNHLLEKITIATRGTYYCPECQK